MHINDLSQILLVTADKLKPNYRSDATAILLFHTEKEETLTKSCISASYNSAATLQMTYYHQRFQSYVHFSVMGVNDLQINGRN
jgi:hypothetical protein